MFHASWSLGSSGTSTLHISRLAGPFRGPAGLFMLLLRTYVLSLLLSHALPVVRTRETMVLRCPSLQIESISLLLQRQGAAYKQYVDSWNASIMTHLGHSEQLLICPLPSPRILDKVPSDSFRCFPCRLSMPLIHQICEELCTVP